MRCLTHCRGFTLYPPAHVPYGRDPVAPVLPDGRSSGNGLEHFVGTIFKAALDAARGEAWPRESNGEPSWPSMCRRLKVAEVWLGVAPGLGDQEREERAADLDVDLLPLLTAAAAIRAAPGYRSRGAAMVKILEELPAGFPLLERLLRAGFAAGLIGEPLVPIRSGGPVRPGGPLRSLARERPASSRSSPGPDPPRKRDVPCSRRGS